MKYKVRTKISPLLIVLGVVLAVYTISMIIPIFWSILSSLKSKWDFMPERAGGMGNFLFGLPSLGEDYGWRFDHYIDALKVVISDGKGSFKVAMMLLNSIVYATGCALFAVGCNTLVAYAIARFDFKFSKILYRLIVVCMVLPIVGAEASALYFANLLHIYDNMVGMFILKGNFIGMYTLVVCEAFRAVPKSFHEAAEIDGASNLRIFVSIAIPMLRNMLATIFLLYFIQFWNDYQTPLLYMPTKFTLAYGIYLIANFSVIPPSAGDEFTGDPFKLTVAMVMLVPVLILFLTFHERIMGNVSLGGVKE